MVATGYLGIDNGTQGLSVIFTDEDLNVLATGESRYDFCSPTDDGCYEQLTTDWDAALSEAMEQVRQQLEGQYGGVRILAIGISGQMHGEVLVGYSGGRENDDDDDDDDDDADALGPVRLWCDARNEEEGHLLTSTLEAKVPKRATSARFLWTVKNRPELASKTRRLTTPAGWTAYRLTGSFHLGVGDAAGMFPIDPRTLEYDKTMLERYDALVNDLAIPPLRSVLPVVRRAGQDAGCVTESGAKLLGLSWPLLEKIPVAPAEGDQVAALAGSLIGRAGTVSCCFGTSVCANLVADAPLGTVSPAVDHFCDAAGKPIHMVWLRNGTTFLNTVVKSYGGIAATAADAFDVVMPLLLEAAPDCGGLLALPFQDDEPGLSISTGGTALVVGWSPENAKPGNIAKAALLSTIFNLKLGCQVVWPPDEHNDGDDNNNNSVEEGKSFSSEQGATRKACHEIVLTGGLTKTPGCGQILADVFNTPVSVHLESAHEGSSWGAAVMAKYRHLVFTGQRKQAGDGENDSDDEGDDWCRFLESIASSQPQTKQQRFEPDPAAVARYQQVFAKYKKLVQVQPQLNEVMVM